MIRLVSETGVAELEVQRGENRVRIRRSFGHETSVFLPGPAGEHAPAPVQTAPAASPKAEAPAPQEPPDTLIYVKSPIVGTFYESASPESQPFVRVGERVQPGKVLCIIESMKLMNEIEAETSGVIESKLVINGQPVEYGEALFAVRTV